MRISAVVFSVQSRFSVKGNAPPGECNSIPGVETLTVVTPALLLVGSWEPQGVLEGVPGGPQFPGQMIDSQVVAVM